jgi:hypothetical protein
MRHHAELVRLALLLVGDQPTAEDVVQDVFAKLHARRAEWPAGAGSLPYIRAAVLNGCRSQPAGACGRKNGIPDPYGIEQGGVVLNGSWYGLCGMPLSAGPDANFELIDTGGRGVVYGFIQHPYRVAVTLSSAGERLPLSSVLLHGTTFFIARLPRSACSYHAMTLRARESQGPAWSGSST